MGWRSWRGWALWWGGSDCSTFWTFYRGVLCRRISYLATGPYAIWPWGEIVGESYTTDLEAVDCPDCSGYSR